MAHAISLVTISLALVFLICLTIAMENEQQPLMETVSGSSSSAQTAEEEVAEDLNTEDQMADFFASLDRSFEEHRLNTAKGFYLEHRKALEDDLDTQRLEWGMPTLVDAACHSNDSATPAFWAHVLSEKGFDDFGFVLFRLDYSDQQSWKRWFEAFDDMVEASMNASTRRTDVKAELIWDLLDDKEILGDSIMQDLPRLFQLGMEVHPGQDLHMALVLDEASMASMLEPKPGVPPWITAVNVYYDFENPLPRDDNYPGFFKVAVDSLIPHLWPLLANEVPPPEFWSWSLNYDDEIFQGFELNERFRMEKYLGYSYFGLAEDGSELYPKEHDEL